MLIVIAFVASGQSKNNYDVFFRCTFEAKPDIINISEDHRKTVTSFTFLPHNLHPKETNPMERADSKLTINDLYIDMEIKDKSQLSNIYDTWILLVKNKNADRHTVQFIGQKTNAESDKLYNQRNVVYPVYNKGPELEGEIYYKEEQLQQNLYRRK